jgi:macrolide transport system ATP-binding/permease protein
MSPIIKVLGLKKYYFPKKNRRRPDGDALVVKAIDGIDLTIFPGEYISITGPSGSGKSTLMQILGLLDRPTEGSYEFLGQEISALDDNQLSAFRSQHLGFIFQSFNLLEHSTASENVELPLIYAGLDQRKARATELLTSVGLGDRLGHRPLELSGGQQQRVAVARALANRPPVLFADEPTGNLNQEAAKQILETLAELNANGVTIIIVTHDPLVAAQTKRVISVLDGKIVADERRDQKSGKVPEIFPQQRRVKGHINLMLENFKMAVKSLISNRLRTALSSIGIMIGVASVIAMAALGAGAQKSMEESLQRLGSNLLSVRPARAPGAGRVESLTLQDAESLRDLKKIGVPIDRVSSEISGSAQVSNGNRNWSTRLQGVEFEYPLIFSATPEVGRFFSEDENKQRARVAVLGKTVYDNIFAQGENPIGSLIKLNHISFQVIGILPSKGGSSFGDRDDIILIPLRTAMYRVLGKDRLDSIGVQIASFDQMSAAQTLVEDHLRKRHKVRAGQDDDFSVMNMADIQDAIGSTTKTMKLLLGAIASISLVVGGIGIMNIMLVSVKERTREIGLRKALGAKNRDILVQFLIEAGVIGLFGGCLGIGLGVGTSYGISVTLEWPVLIASTTVLIAFGFSLFIGVFFGFWPAFQASKLSPIEALRY